MMINSSALLRHIYSEERQRYASFQTRPSLCKQVMIWNAVSMTRCSVILTAGSANAADDCLWWSNIHILHVTGEAGNDSAIDTEEGAWHVASIRNVHMADGLNDICGCPCFTGGDGDSPLVLCGINQGNRYVGV